MDNKQYKDLMWHLSYVESLLEKLTDTTDFVFVQGGGTSALLVKQNFASSSRLAKLRVRMLNARIAVHWKDIGRCGFCWKN